MGRGMRYPGHVRVGRAAPIGRDALLIGGTAAAVGLSTAAVLNSNAVTAPATQPVVINQFVSLTDNKTEWND